MNLAAHPAPLEIALVQLVLAFFKRLRDAGEQDKVGGSHGGGIAGYFGKSGLRLSGHLEGCLFRHPVMMSPIPPTVNSGAAQ